MIVSLHKELPYYFETCRLSSLTLQTCLTKYRKSNDPSARPSNRFSAVDPYCFECAEGAEISKNNGGNTIMGNENERICVRPDCKLLGVPQSPNNFYARDNSCKPCRNKMIAGNRKLRRKLKKEAKGDVAKKAPAKNLVFLVKKSGIGEESLYSLYSESELQKALQAGKLPAGNIVKIGSIESTMVVKETVRHELVEG